MELGLLVIRTILNGQKEILSSDGFSGRFIQKLDFLFDQ
jgi:hypothetical protein